MTSQSTFSVTPSTPTTPPAQSDPPSPANSPNLANQPTATDPSPATDLITVTAASSVTDPNTATDPSAVTNPSAATDPSVVTDPCTVTDPSTTTNLITATDPNTTAEPTKAVAGYPTPTPTAALAPAAPTTYKPNHDAPNHDAGNSDGPNHDGPNHDVRNHHRPRQNSLDRIRLARAYLLRVVEPPADAVLRLIADCGPIRAAQRIATGDVPPDVADETSARSHLANPERDLAEATAVKGRLLIPEDPDWPTWALSALDLAKASGVPWAGQPIALWIRGPANLAEFTDRAVSLVGARASTDYGERIAAEFGYELAAAGFTVVSGAAYGIDGAAHRGALSADGPTVAVLGCGIAVPYPSGHATLLSSIAKTGAVISEYPPKTPPARHRFLVRNRLIAALSAGSVVIEAGRRSGTRNTAAAAGRLGRTVMAVPGPIGSAMSVGCHDLLRTGAACLVASVQDVIESVGRIGADLAPEPSREVRETDGLDQRALRVFDALDRRKEHSTERLAVLAGVPLDGVRAALPELELRGLAARGDAGWRSTTRKARGDA